MIFFIVIKPKSKILSIKILNVCEKEYFNKMKFFFSFSAVVPMLVAFFFINDALITVSNNYPIYVERVFGVSDNIKNYLLLAILLMSAIGGVISGWVADKIGALKTLKLIFVGWIILIPLIASSSSLLSLSIYSSISGLFVGSGWAVTRAYLSEVLKKEELSYGFSFYTIIERFATFVGPLTWGGIIAVLGTHGSSYRIAMLSMTAFVIIGLIILLNWKREMKTVTISEMQ